MRNVSPTHIPCTPHAASPPLPTCVPSLAHISLSHIDMLACPPACLHHLPYAAHMPTHAHLHSHTLLPVHACPPVHIHLPTMHACAHMHTYTHLHAHMHALRAGG